MSGHSTYTPSNGFTRWIDSRLPIIRLGYDSFVAYPTPRNLNYWWTFGAILSMMLAVQIITGIVLAMHYTPETTLAFDSVERIVRDVNYGWLLRNMHAAGASMFFIAVYVHMLRGLYYGSYKAPREVLWILGVVIFMAMMATVWRFVCVVVSRFGLSSPAIRASSVHRVPNNPSADRIRVRDELRSARSSNDCA